MGWLGSLLGLRRCSEERRRTEDAVRAALVERGPDSAWVLAAEALAEDPDHGALLRLAGQILRAADESETAELFDRAADAPHDPQRLFELGSALLSVEQPELASVLLERALRFEPFDAVVRSELALARARSGRPDLVLETLALHPCLGEDPGALFQFGWAALLTGDLDAARGALGELRGPLALRRKLALALERAELGAAKDPPDARDFYFVQHGGLLLDAGGPLRGRYESLGLDAAWTARVLQDLGWVLHRLMPSPRHVVSLDEDHLPLAEAVAMACEGRVLPAGRGRLPSGVLPLRSASSIREQLDAISRQTDELMVFALTMDWRHIVPRAPELVGAFIHGSGGTAPLPIDVSGASRSLAVSDDVRDFVESRRAYLPPAGTRVRSAYLPDAPLPRRAAG